MVVAAHAWQAAKASADELRQALYARPDLVYSQPHALLCRHPQASLAGKKGTEGSDKGIVTD